MAISDGCFAVIARCHPCCARVLSRFLRIGSSCEHSSHGAGAGCTGGVAGWTQGEQGANASTMARRLGYSAMSMSRATRWCLAAPAREVWHKAAPMLRSPVLRRGGVKLDRAAQAELPLAGLSALAEQTVLVQPSQPVYVLSEATWQTLCKYTPCLRLEDEQMADAVCIELWCYKPRILMPEGGLHVDPYSLTLSLRDEAAADERVALAMEALLGQIEGSSTMSAPRGLETFRRCFEGFADQYVLIGGTANYLALDAAGLDARATKDLDPEYTQSTCTVLLVEFKAH